MKRAGRLFDKWCNRDNFYEALKEVRKGKTLHDTFISFERKAPIHIENLINEIKSNKYKPMPYRSFKVFEPKERIISAPHLRDRVVQHALMREIKKYIDSRFISQNFACRIGKGTHKCSKLLVDYLKNFDNGYCLKIDISKFFYEINRDILMIKIENIIKCKKSLDVISKFIYEDENEKGIPIGNLTSQLFANLMLNDLDHFCKRKLKCEYYIRYMDDIVILDNNKDKLHFIFKKIKSFVENEKLKVNPKSGVFDIKQGVDFVGYRTWKNKRLIRKQSLFRIRKSLKKGFNKNRVSSYLAHAKDTNSLHYVQNIINQYKE